MVGQNMLLLKERLGVRSDEIECFYVFYRHLNLSLRSNEGLKAHAMKSLVVRRLDLLYSYFVDLVLALGWGRVSEINLNCSYKRFSYFKRKSKFHNFLYHILGREIYFQRYLKGLAGRGRIYEALHAHGCRDEVELWAKIKEDRVIRSEVEALSRKLNFVFKRLGAKRLFAIDFSDSLSLLALYSAKKSGVKVLVIPHGYVQDYSELYNYAHLAGSYICWSRTEAEQVFKLMGGGIETRYFGCPVYSKDDVVQFREDWLVNSRKRGFKRVVFFCNPISLAKNEQDYKDFIVWLNGFLKERGIEFQIKLHQRDALDEMERYFKDCEVDVVYGPAEQILLGADLVLGYQTTVLYQAATLNLPALQLLLDGQFSFKFDFVDQVSADKAVVGDSIMSRIMAEGSALENHGLDRVAIREYLES